MSGDVIFGNDWWLAGIHPRVPVPGCISVQTRNHVEGVWNLGLGEAASLGDVLRLVTSAIRSVCDVEKVYAVSLGENTPHFHILLIPRARDGRRNASTGVELLRTCLEGSESKDLASARAIAESIRGVVSQSQLQPLTGDRPRDPRVSPLALQQMDPAVREWVSRTFPQLDPELNIFATLVRHRELCEGFLQYNETLLAGKLPSRDRELLILRIAWNSGAEYEWGQHVTIARLAGVTDEEIQRVPAGPSAPSWAPQDATLLRTVDELVASACVSQRTWNELAARYDEAQLIEIPLLVGHYQALGYLMNSLGVQREEDIPGWPIPRPIEPPRVPEGA